MKPLFKNEDKAPEMAFPLYAVIPPDPQSGRLQSTVVIQSGMSLRDYFAGQALAFVPVVDGSAKMAYAIADQMLKARENEKS